MRPWPLPGRREATRALRWLGTSVLSLVVVALVVGCGDDHEPVDDVLVDVADSATDLSDETSPSDTSVGPQDTTLPTCGATRCATGEACCDYTCVSVVDDPAHCGGCGVACAASEVCTGGVCVCGDGVCAQHERCCDGSGGAQCRPLGLDPLNCGACGNVCASTEPCISGICACAGPDGFEACEPGASCCPGDGCHDLDSDPLHCGACGHACGPGEYCQAGVCACGDTVADGFATACGTDALCCGDPPTCHTVDDPVCLCGSSLCGAGQTCCEISASDGSTVDECVALYRDPIHCGACGIACGRGERCRGGACECWPAFADCDGDPTNGCEAALDSDVGHCGACDRACPGSEVCTGAGFCGLTCQIGYVDCARSCVDPASSPFHCGTCDRECPQGEVCSGADCRTSCQPGLLDCARACVNPLADRRHCGGCDRACNAGEVCNLGYCALSCETGFVDCGGNCIDPYSNGAHCGLCGNACEPGTVCSGGQCVTSCPQSTIDCGGGCVDLRRDRTACGSCGRGCAPGEVCADGDCRATCPTDATDCGGICVDTRWNRAHCGACGNACASDQVCSVGVCEDSCELGLVECAGTCVDTRIDPSNCGGCGVRCATDERCVGASCVACPAGTSLCGAECVDLSADPQHCGTCGQSCASHQSCQASLCTCDAPFADCNASDTDGCESDLSQDNENCGTCGVSCAGRPCFSGSCGTEPAAVRSGDTNTCILRASGQVQCWGANDLGQLGSGAIGVPRFRVDAAGSDVLGLVASTATPLTGATQVTTGARHACALLSGGEVWCWGDGERGQLGDGTQSPRGLASPAGLSSAVQVEAGGSHTCALLTLGRLRCWGDGTRGQIGFGSVTEVRTLPTAVTLDGNAVPRAVSAGRWHTCAVTSTGAVQCWGANESGQLGDGTNTDAWAPVTVGGVTGASAVDAGGAHACALLASGAVWCWGANGAGQLGDGTTTSRATAQPVTGITDAVAVTTGERHTCARRRTGALTCWGEGTFAQLGDGTRASSTTPVVVAGTADFLDASAGARHTCGARTTGQVDCWGFIGGGQLGRDTASETWGPVAGLSADSLSLDGEQACALSGTTVDCWGLVPRGTDLSGSDVPIAVSGLGAVVDIGLAARSACAARADGTVACWGDNTFGQLGVSSIAASDTPVDPAVIDAAQVACGAEHCCALQNAGTVVCWGANLRGQLGDGCDGSVPANRCASPTVRGTKVQVINLNDAVAITAGDYHNCVLSAAGEVWCWGGNQRGQAGTGLTENGIPTLVPGLTGIAEVAAGGNTTCARSTAGQLWCWGDATRGQVGSGDLLPQTTPVAVVDTSDTPLAGVIDVDVAADRACAVVSDGTLRCWGDNRYGQLGSDCPGDLCARAAVVGGVADVLTVGVGGNPDEWRPHRTCVDTALDSVLCRGDNRLGHLGNGGTVQTARLPVTGL